MRFLLLFLIPLQILTQVQVNSDSTALDQDTLLSTYWIYPDDPFVKELDNGLHEMFSIQSSFLNPIDDTLYPFPKDSVPKYSEIEVRDRLAQLDAATPLQLTYNKYTARMIAFYIDDRRAMLSRVLGLSQLYYPLYEAELKKENMPLELKHLSVVESALINKIRSRAGAVGLWQFMYNTGKYLGMEINSYVDERCDPIVATKTAVKYLKYLHNLYDDWYMALAAYNAGPGNVNKAIRRSGGKRTFWEIYPYLPRETRSYVPAFIAVNYAMSFPVEHNIRPTRSKYLFHDIDTVQVNQAVDLAQVSQVLCIPIGELQFLNPQYTQDHVPKQLKKNKKYCLSLPVELVGQFVINEEAIYHYDVLENIDSASVDSILPPKEIIHRVRSGQSLGSIANKYDVSVKQIKAWNNMRSSTIHPKQKLKIILPREEQRKKVSKKKKKSKYLYYTVKSGDTLSEIAERYRGVSVKSLMRLNNLNRRSKLFPGRTIKIKKK